MMQDPGDQERPLPITNMMQDPGDQEIPLPLAKMIRYSVYFPCDSPTMTSDHNYPENPFVDGNNPHTNTNRSPKHQKNLYHISKSALSKSTSSAVRKVTNARVAKEIEKHHAHLRHELVLQKKRMQEKQARIAKQRNESKAFCDREDAHRKKAIERSEKLRRRNNHDELIGSNRMLNRLLKKTSHPPPSKASGSSDPYKYAKERMDIAIGRLIEVLKEIETNKYKNCQEKVLSSIKNILSNHSLPLKTLIKIFCKSYSAVHRFDASVTTSKYPHVFLNLFSSRKAKEDLFIHLIHVFGSEDEQNIVQDEKQDVQTYVLDVLCGLVRLQCLNVPRFIEWYTGTLTGSPVKTTSVPKTKISIYLSTLNNNTTSSNKRNTINDRLLKIDESTQQRARERARLFFEWHAKHQSDGPRQLKEEASIEIIALRMKNYYSTFHSPLNTTTKKHLYKEIIKIVSGIDDDDDDGRSKKSGRQTKIFDKRSETAGRVFAGAWCSVYVKQTSTGTELKQKIERYDSLFLSIFKHHANLEHLLTNIVLLALSNHSQSGSQKDDPLIGCLKGLYNIYALDGQYLLEWHHTKLGQFKPLMGLLSKEKEKMLKTRTALFVGYLNEETQGKRKPKNEHEQKKRKKALTKKERREDQLLIPCTVRRAPGLVERDQRLGRKQWASSKQQRPETPLFTKGWSPLDGVVLTDRSKPQYPKTIHVHLLNNVVSSKSTAHRHTSQKQQELVGHYHQKPKPPRKKKPNEKRKGVNKHRKLVQTEAIGLM